jgi:hypothetical protein
MVLDRVRPAIAKGGLEGEQAIVDRQHAASTRWFMKVRAGSLNPVTARALVPRTDQTRSLACGRKPAAKLS